MTNLILILMFFGLILSFFGFLFSTFYFHDKLPDHKILLVALFFTLPGIFIFTTANHYRKTIPLIISEGCGTVQQYKQYSIKGHHYERLEIVMDGSGYQYALAFDSKLPRLKEKQQVCFKFYDRFKNKGMANSTLIEIQFSTKDPQQPR